MCGKFIVLFDQGSGGQVTSVCNAYVRSLSGLPIGEGKSQGHNKVKLTSNQRFMKLFVSLINFFLKPSDRELFVA